MPPRHPRRRSVDPPPFPEEGLARIGLTPGERVRFRPRAGAHWVEATVVRRERDGSVGLTDGKGAARALPLERLEVRTTGPRGGVVWEPLAERAGRTQQMKLL